MPSCTKALNPCRLALSWYGPTGRFGNAYAPSSPVIAFRAMPVSVCVTVTSTPGSAPPLESRTNPVIWAPPTAWARATAGVATNIAPIHSATRAFTASLLAGLRRRGPLNSSRDPYSPRR